jgi:hypothetical protein
MAMTQPNHPAALAQRYFVLRWDDTSKRTVQEGGFYSIVNAQVFAAQIPDAYVDTRRPYCCVADEDRALEQTP